MDGANEFCKLVEYPESMGDPRYSLIFSRFEDRLEYLEMKGLAGDGYTWRDIVESLVHLHHPEIIEMLAFDPESSMFCVRSSNRAALRLVAGLIRKANTSIEFLEQALSQSGRA